MVPGYEEVLKRFKAERIRYHFTQKEVSFKIDMTQSHFSKAESGEKHFTYEQVKKLNQLGYDIHYIYTDKRVKSLRYQEISESINPSQYYFLGRLFYVILEEVSNCYETEKYKKIHDKSAIMRYILNNEQKNIWRLLRDYLDNTQVEMAHTFNFDIKKYVCLEKEKIHPDSESIFLLYKHFYIPPQIVLGDNRGILSAICEIMDELNEEDRTKVIKFIKIEQQMFG